MTLSSDYLTDEADVPRSNSQSAALGIVKLRLHLNCLSDSQRTVQERVSRALRATFMKPQGTLILLKCLCSFAPPPAPLPHPALFEEREELCSKAGCPTAFSRTTSSASCECHPVQISCGEGGEGQRAPFYDFVLETRSLPL